MSKLKVALLVPRFPNLVQPYIFNQVVAMEKSGIDIKIIAGHGNATNRQHTDNKDTYPKRNPLHINTSFKNVAKHAFSRTALNRKYLYALFVIIRSHHWSHDNVKNLFKKMVYARAISTQNFDIIHSHSLFTTSNYLFLQCDFNIPIVTTYHGALPPGVAKLSDERMLKIFRKGSLFLVNTESAKNDLKNLGCPNEKIQVIPQGINIENFPYQKHAINKKKHINLLSVGRLSSEKGHAIAVNAIASLVKQFPTLQYHIVGDGPEKNALQQQILEQSLTKNITLHGFKTLEDLTVFYSSADIFILPSLIETQGTVIQEAQSSGIPVVASMTGGIPEVVHNNKTGLLFKTDDYHDLAIKIKVLITNSKLYKELSIAGRKDIEARFEIQAVTQKLISIYNDVIGHHNKKPIDPEIHHH